MKKKRIHHHAANKIRQLFAKKQPDAREREEPANSVAAEYTHESPQPTQRRAIDGNHSGQGGDNGKSDQGNSRPSPYEESQLRLTRWLVVATAVIAVATVIYMAFSGLQLREIRSTGEDTRNLAQSAGRSANAAKEQVNAMRGQLDTMNQQANTMREQTNTMIKSLDLTNRAVSSGEKQANASQVSARAAERSVIVAQDTLAIEQRPWVLMQDMKSSQHLFINQPFLVTLTLFNYGNSPAMDFRAIGRMAFKNKIPDPIRSDDPDLVNDSPITLPPKQDSKIPLEGTFNKNTVDRVNTQRLTFYVWGRLEYKDIFSQPHYTIFCAYQGYLGTGIYPCKKGNYAN